MLNDFTNKSKQVMNLLPDNRINITLLRNTEALVINNYTLVPLDKLSSSPLKT